MATSEVQIINSALMKLGQEPVSARTENNKRARIMDQQYDLARQSLLRHYVWNFAKERIELAPLVETPEFGFLYKSLLPARCLRVIGLYNEAEPSYQINYTGSRIPFKVEGRHIFSDEDPLRIFIMQDVTDPAQFDALFVNCFAWFLASETAIAITNDKGKYGIADKAFQEAIKAARAANAMEGTPEYIESTVWLDARHYHSAERRWRIGPVAY